MWWLVGMVVVVMVVAAALVVLGYCCRLTSLEALQRPLSRQRSRVDQVVTRSSVMDACDYVVDVMVQPRFWSSCVSRRQVTLESVLQALHQQPLPRARLYVPLPILNCHHRTLLKGLRPDQSVEVVSNHGDEPPLPAVWQELVADPRLHALYVNNVALDFPGHPKVHYIPLGYGHDQVYRRLVRSSWLLEVSLARVPGLQLWVKNHPRTQVLQHPPRKPWAEKECAVLCAFGPTGSEWTRPDLRRQCRAYLARHPFGRVQPFASKETYFGWHEDVAFELSPFGNGVECFRTWEALLLHTVPIVFHSPVDALYAGLPVCIVDRVEDITVERLQAEKARWAGWFETHNIRRELEVKRWLP